jgi:hypothetical protein
MTSVKLERNDDRGYDWRIGYVDFVWETHGAGAQAPTLGNSSDALRSREALQLVRLPVTASSRSIKQRQ